MLLNSTSSDIILNENSLKLLEEYSLKITIDENINCSIGKFNVAISIISVIILECKSIYITEYISFSGISGEMEFTAEKFHELYTESNYTKVISVEISGEVQFPGTYTLPENATIADLYVTAGSYNDSADKEVAILSRKSIAEQNREAAEKAKKEVRDYLIANSGAGNSLDSSIISLINQEYNDTVLGRISGDFTADSKNSSTFLLEDGDKLFIPKKISTISIIGEVLNPITLIYDSELSIDDYVDKAGGFKQFALKKSLYVIKSDGTVVSDKGSF